MITVIGATGQLGSAVVRRLLSQGESVTALVRDQERAAYLERERVRLVPGDLREPATLPAAVDGADVVIATANSVSPRPGDDPGVDEYGYRYLVHACETAGVGRFVYASSPSAGALDDAVMVTRAKRRTEQLLQDSSMSYAVLRLAPFTDVWLALVGSSVPLRGEEHSSLRRPYPFLQRYRALTGRLVEDRGIMLVPGPADAPNAFLTVADAAALLAASARSPLVDRAVVEVGGPEVLTWRDVARTFERVLGRPVRVVTTPAAAFAVVQAVLSPFAPSASTVMGLNRLMGTVTTPWDCGLAKDLGVWPLTTVEEYLGAKAALPDR